ncbi:hypothetical protein [Deinococcus rufus]|uniref:Uncharacterized protein n=1 Tax=Deinococcus rufus TaxID=2136097 RepID=A0ABV7Z8X3_9DEIO
MKRRAGAAFSPPSALPGPALTLHYPAQVTLPEHWDGSAPIDTTGPAGPRQVTVTPAAVAPLRSMVTRAAVQGGQLVLMLDRTGLSVVGVTLLAFAPRDALELIVREDGDGLRDVLERLNVQDWETAVLGLGFTLRPGAAGPGWAAPGPAGTEALLLGLDGGCPSDSQTVRFVLRRRGEVLRDVSFLQSRRLTD